jgi:MSHA biogenesis protein MshP
MRKLQQGFSLVSAIFLLVVIAALGTFAVTLSTTQHQSEAMDVMGARAYQAARAGIEWAAFQVVNSPLNAPSAATCATNFAQNSLGGALAPFAVAVTCTAASHIEDTSTVWIYDVNAVAKTAGSPGDPGYVERVISVKMGK